MITHFPGLTDAEGRNLGLFQIDPIDDVAHALTAAFAGFAAWHSSRASLTYFRLFGLVYGADGVVGVANGIGVQSPAVNFAINAPHLAIAAAALVIGYVAHKRFCAGVAPGALDAWAR